MSGEIRSTVVKKLIEPLRDDPELGDEFVKRFDRKRILFDFGEEPFYLRIYGSIEVRSGLPLHYDLKVSGNAGLLSDMLEGREDPVAAILSGRIQFEQPSHPEDGLHDATDMLYLQDTMRKLVARGGRG